MLDPLLNIQSKDVHFVGMGRRDRVQQLPQKIQKVMEQHPPKSEGNHHSIKPPKKPNPKRGLGSFPPMDFPGQHFDLSSAVASTACIGQVIRMDRGPRVF